MNKYLMFIFSLFLMVFLKTSKADEFYHHFICLDRCLRSIEGSRHLYDVVLFNLHNTIELEINESGLSLSEFNSSDENRHRVVEFLLRSDGVSELVTARGKLIDIYKKLYVDCDNKKKKDVLEENESFLPDRSLINGQNYFDIQKVLRSDDYKYKLEHSIANGLGIGMNDIDYDPQNMSYKVRIGKNGKILLNERTIKIVKEKIRIKRLAGIEITPRELIKEKHALEPAHFIYQGTINIVDQSSSCKSVSRGLAEEDYCLKGLSTFLQRTDVKTGEITNISQTSLQIRPFYISENIRGKTEDHTSRGNLSQINSTLRLIEGSVCQNRNEMHGANSEESGFPFRLPCREYIEFPIPAPISKY